jgi:hypothetical protein
MKRKKLFWTALIACATMLTLTATAIYAIKPTVDCIDRYDDGCASGNDTCYFWIAGSGEPCFFEYSIFN